MSILIGCSSDGQLIIVSHIEANIITSPGYPQTNYWANTSCDWTFQAPRGQKISFTLLELETEFGYDVLKLYDGAGGEEEKEPILATMSGNKIHNAVISSKEQMRVTFTTDINNNMKGFKASVSAFNKEGKELKIMCTHSHTMILIIMDKIDSYFSKLKDPYLISWMEQDRLLN